MDLSAEEEKEDEEPDPLRVAMVSCAFRNSALLGWLTERGAAIKRQDFGQVDEINAKI